MRARACFVLGVFTAAAIGCGPGISVGGGGGNAGLGGAGAGPGSSSGGQGTPASGGASASGGAPGSGGRASGSSGGAPGSGGRAPGSSGGASAGGGAPAGSGGASASGGAAGAGTQPPPVGCATPLGQRVTITSIPVTPKIVTKGNGINSVSLPVILATSPNGRAKVAWSDGTNVHVTPLDAAGARAAADVMVAGTEVRGFVAHDDGGAVLVRRADVMAVVRVNEAGAVQAMYNVVGGTDHTVSGARWIDDWPHQGRLGWSGTQYAAYFGQTGNHGSAGNHQGDQYAFVLPAGTKASGGWDWGCSHSLDERLAHNGTAWAPICVSDTYPGAGIFFANKTKISDEPTVTSVGGVAKLGGLVPTTDGFLLTFTSPEGRSAPDVAFVKLSNTGAPSGKVYITDTSSVTETWAHLAAYGTAGTSAERFLAGWDTGNNTAINLAVVDKAGAVVEPAMVTTAKLGGQDDFATFANGDVGWAGAWDDLAQLRVVRVAACK